MVNYSLARDRYIGMIQTNENNELYNIGCLGKIHSFNETEDGRYLISLQGTNCFKVLKELNLSFSFRLVDTELIKQVDGKKTLSDLQKVNLLKKYRNYIKIKNINLNLDDIENIEVSQIVKFIAMVSPFKNEDKQVLLETFNIVEFYEKLLSILDLEILGDFSKKTIN